MYIYIYRERERESCVMQIVRQDNKSLLTHVAPTLAKTAE